MIQFGIEPGASRHPASRPAAERQYVIRRRSYASRCSLLRGLLSNGFLTNCLLAGRLFTSGLLFSRARQYFFRGHACGTNQARHRRFGSCCVSFRPEPEPQRLVCLSKNHNSSSFFHLVLSPLSRLPLSSRYEANLFIPPRVNYKQDPPYCIASDRDEPVLIRIIVTNRQCVVVFKHGCSVGKINSVLS